MSGKPGGHALGPVGLAVGAKVPELAIHRDVARGAWLGLGKGQEIVSGEEEVFFQGSDGRGMG